MADAGEQVIATEDEVAADPQAADGDGLRTMAATTLQVRRSSMESIGRVCEFVVLPRTLLQLLLLVAPLPWIRAQVVDDGARAAKSRGCFCSASPPPMRGPATPMRTRTPRARPR